MDHRSFLEQPDLNTLTIKKRQAALPFVVCQE